MERRFARRATLIHRTPLMRAGMRVALTAAAVSDVREYEDAGAAGSSLDVDLVLIGGDAATVLVGLRLCRERPTPPATIAVVSTLGRDEMRAMAAFAVHAVVVSRVAVDELTETVSRVLAGERVMSEATLPLLLGLESAPTEDETGPLTDRERHVVRLLAQGRSNAEIAAELFVSVATAKSHLAHIYVKLGAHNRLDALRHAAELGVIP